MGERVSPVPKRLLRSRRIRKAKISGDMIEKEFAVAESDLASAVRSLRDGDHKWATVQGYYSIFHAARALLFARGYREKSHRVSKRCCEIFIHARFLNKCSMTSETL